MADPKRSGPTTSSRIAGIIAILAILLGGYFGLVAVRHSEKTEPAAASATAGSDAAKPADSAANDTAKTANDAAKTANPAPLTAADGGATAKPDANSGAANSAAAKPADGSDAAKPQQQAALTPPAEPAKPGAAAPGDAAKAGSAAMPSFDIVRVEPSGSTVVAGTAEPKAKVEIMDGANPIASTQANQDGQWATDITKPLAPGSHDLSIRTTSPDQKTETLSEQHVAVDVQKDGKGEPLVVLATPDAASKVLQKPAPTPSEPKLAAAPPPAAATNGQGAAAKPDTGAPAAGTQADAGKAGAAAPTGAAPDAAAPNAATANTATANAAAPDAGATAAGAAAAPAPGGAAKAPAVTVDAVEFENGRLFVAGSAASGAIVRIYMDDAVVGQVKAGEGNRFLLETQHDVANGQHKVRADQVDPGTGNVIVRAEVPFEKTQDVAELAPVTSGAGATGASADGSVPPPQTVIIRQGDNLWTISRRLYGRGIHYSTIYQANDDQIRNPHWIYPGQVFTLPVGDTKWVQ